MKFDIVAGDSIKDKEERIWIWDRVHNLIGYFYGDIYKFHIANQYKEGAFDGLSMYLREEVIYIVSQAKGNVLAYDIHKNSFQFYKSDKQKGVSQYYSARIDQDKLMIFSYELRYGAILFDIQKKEFKEIERLKTVLYSDKVISSLIETEQKIMIAVSDSNEIVTIRKEDLTCFSDFVPDIENIGKICADGEDTTWAISKNGESLIRYTEEEYEKIEIGEKQEQEACSRLVKYGEKIIMLPRYATELYIYDCSGKKIHKVEVEVPSEQKKFGNGASLFWNCFKENGKLVLLPWRYRQMLELDLNSLDVKMCSANITGSDFRKISPSKTLFENREMALCVFLEFVDRIEEKDKGDGCQGIRIWEGLLKDGW